MKYYVADREAGNIIEECNSYAEAEAVIAKYEAIDKAEGNYEPDFYDIVNAEHEHIDE